MRIDNENKLGNKYLPMRNASIVIAELSGGSKILVTPYPRKGLKSNIRRST
jgi:hypothetical protein